jgi:hypothetical protein
MLRSDRSRRGRDQQSQLPSQACSARFRENFSTASGLAAISNAGAKTGHCQIDIADVFVTPDTVLPRTIRQFGNCIDAVNVR